MPIAKPAAARRLYAASIICLGLTSAGHATIRAPDTPVVMRTLSCEFPVRLTHDCSIWQGATRPIAIGDYRMTLAADRAGTVVLISQLRPGPDHNGSEFRRTGRNQWRDHSSADAIRLIGRTLEDRGIHLERTEAVRRGRNVQAYLLEFSDDAYAVLKQFTVLESEYWLAPQRSVR